MPIGRLRVVLGLNRKKYLPLLAKGKAVHTGLDTHTAEFPNPNPALPMLLQQIQDFEKAQQLAATRAVGAAEARDIKRDVLITSLECERMYVQSLCDANPEQAANLAKMVAMDLAAIGARVKPLLAARNVLPQGTVILEANARLLDKTHRAKFYNWSYTLDGGKTFIVMPPTPVARTTISGLPALTTVGFRVSVTVSGQPQGEWSQVVSILVQ